MSHDGVSRLFLKFQSYGLFLYWDGVFWCLNIGFPKHAAPIEHQSPQEAIAADIAVSFEAKSGLSFAQAVLGLTSDVAALATNLFFEELAHAKFYEAGGVVNVAFKQIIAFANAQPSGIALKDSDVGEVDTGEEELHSQVGGGAVNRCGMCDTPYFMSCACGELTEPTDHMPTPPPLDTMVSTTSNI